MNPTGYPQLDALLPRLEAIPGLDADALHAERIALLGRKQGALTFALRALPTFAAEERKRFGAEANRLKEAFEAAFAAREAELAAAAGPAGSGLDLTMPGRGRWIGAPHPVTRVVDEIIEIFRELGEAASIQAGADLVQHFAQAEEVGLRRAGSFRREVAFGAYN